LRVTGAGNYAAAVALNLVYSVYGIWYSDALFKQKGWRYQTPGTK
jgi:hypothetical protein